MERRYLVCVCVRERGRENVDIPMCVNEILFIVHSHGFSAVYYPECTFLQIPQSVFS